MKVVLKRSTPVEFSYANAAGEMTTFTAPACTVGGYREALRLEADGAGGTALETATRLLNQAVALCGESCRPHLESMDIEMVQEVIQAQVAAHAGLEPGAVVEVMRAAKKKALLAAARGGTFSPSMS